jgi:hypothetical protein
VQRSVNQDIKSEKNSSIPKYAVLSCNYAALYEKLGFLVTVFTDKIVLLDTYPAVLQAIMRVAIYPKKR